MHLAAYIVSVLLSDCLNYCLHPPIYPRDSDCPLVGVLLFFFFFPLSFSITSNCQPVSLFVSVLLCVCPSLRLSFWPPPPDCLLVSLLRSAELTVRRTQTCVSLCTSINPVWLFLKDWASMTLKFTTVSTREAPYVSPQHTLLLVHTNTGAV